MIANRYKHDLGHMLKKLTVNRSILSELNPAIVPPFNAFNDLTTSGLINNFYLLK